MAQHTAFKKNKKKTVAQLDIPCIIAKNNHAINLNEAENIVIKIHFRAITLPEVYI